MPRLPAFILVPLTLTLGPGAAFAHNVGVSCKIHGNRVEVEVYFDDDTPAVNAKIVVVDNKEAIVLTGVADKSGKCTFPTSAPGTYEIRVDAGAGHRAKTTVIVPAPVETPQTVSAGPTRAEFTAVPWVKVAIGLTVIAALSGAIVIASMVRRKARGEPVA